MLEVGDRLVIPAAEIQWHAIRAQGAGGQNVNKVASAVHLRFDARTSTALPEDVRTRLLALPDRRIGSDGVVTIKAQRFRTQDKNLADALARLATLLEQALVVPKARKATRPGKAAKERRLKEKSHRAAIKAGRGPVRD